MRGRTRGERGAADLGLALELTDEACRSQARRAVGDLKGRVALRVAAELFIHLLRAGTVRAMQAVCEGRPLGLLSGGQH